MRYTFLRALIAIASGAVCSAAVACSCSQTSLGERLDSAELAMVVRVVTTRLDTSREDDSTGQTGAIYATFDVLETLKGDAAAVHGLQGAYENGNCALRLTSGSYYLVVADEAAASVLVSLCSGSTELSGFGPGGRRASLDQIRLDAVRAYVRDGVPIDSCLDFLDVPPPPAPGGKDRCTQLIHRLFDQYHSGT